MKTMNVDGRELPKLSPASFRDAALYYLAEAGGWQPDVSVPLTHAIYQIAQIVLEPGITPEDYGNERSSGQPQVTRWVQAVVNKTLKKNGCISKPDKDHWALTNGGLAEAKAVKAKIEKHLADRNAATSAKMDEILDVALQEQQPQTVRVEAEVTNIVRDEEGNVSFEEAGTAPMTITVNDDGSATVSPVAEQDEEPAPTAEELTNMILGEETPKENTMQEDPATTDLLNDVFEQVAALPSEEATVEEEQPTMEDTVLFAVATTCAFAVTGKLFSITDSMENIRILLGDNAPSNLTNAVLDAHYNLKQEGYLEGTQNDPSKSSLSEKGRDHADLLGNKFFDQHFPKLANKPIRAPHLLENQVSPEDTEPDMEETPKEVDPYAGEKGSTEHPVVMGDLQIKEIPEDICWEEDGGYIKGKYIQQAKCFGEKFNPEHADCQGCFVAVECYTALVDQLYRMAEELPVVDIDLRTADSQLVQRHTGKYYTLSDAVDQAEAGLPYAIGINTADGSFVQYVGDGMGEVQVTVSEPNGNVSQATLSYGGMVSIVQSDLADNGSSYVESTVNWGANVEEEEDAPTEAPQQAFPVAETTKPTQQTPTQQDPTTGDVLMYTLEAASKRAWQGKTWTIQLEYANQATNSDKFYVCEGKGRNDEVRVTYGRRGTAGSTLVKDWDYVESNVPKKLNKGYEYHPATVNDENSEPKSWGQVGTQDTLTRVDPKPTTPAPTGNQAPTPAPDANQLVDMEVSEANLVCGVCGQRLNPGEMVKWDLIGATTNPTGNNQYHKNCV